MVNLDEIANNQLKNIATGELVSMSNFWKDQAVVFVFFRRWGCLVCRLWAKEISAIHDVLKEHDVKLVGVGFDDYDVQDFIKGKFFKGELYLDVGMKTYTYLGFRRFNYFTVLASLLTKESCDAICKGNKLNMPGNLKGEWLQNGGALIVGKDGRLLYEFKQKGPANRVKNSDILKLLDIPAIEGIDEKVEM